MQLGKGSPIGGLGPAVVVGEAVVDGAASCGEMISRHWDRSAVYGDVFKGSVQHLTGGFIEQNSSCSDVSKWKSSRATYPD